MSDTIIAAIIGAAGAIIAALIGLLAQHRRSESSPHKTGAGGPSNSPTAIPSASQPPVRHASAPHVGPRRWPLIAMVLLVLLAGAASWMGASYSGLVDVWPFWKNSTVSQPEEAEGEFVRSQVQIRSSRSANQVDTFKGTNRHEYSIWIEAPPEVFSRIHKVLYHFDHSAFENPRPEAVNPSNGFRTSYVGIGAVDRDMDVILVLNNGNIVALKYNMYRAIFRK